ncbi:hypothetical protein [Embleya sp. NPDC050493]|uniref:hypothetical protein n=1 Tax=Embleya sp. NPDC050493 TaxID=3363989 RepID=UPI0037954410
MAWLLWGPVSAVASALAVLSAVHGSWGLCALMAFTCVSVATGCHRHTRADP